LKTIFTEDFSRPKYRDTSVPYIFPLPEQTASGHDDSMSITPAYRSVQVPVPYDSIHTGSYFLIKLSSAKPAPSGAVRIYGWRAPQAFISNPTTIQYSRYEGYDFIDLEPTSLSKYGPDSTYAISISDSWQWVQLACFWPAQSVAFFLSDKPITGIVSPDNATQVLPTPEPFIADNFGDTP
jgi:hypothetical protein